jgi:hypothetical protein
MRSMDSSTAEEAEVSVGPCQYVGEAPRRRRMRTRACKVPPSPSNSTSPDSKLSTSLELTNAWRPASKSRFNEVQRRLRRVWRNVQSFSWVSRLWLFRDYDTSYLGISNRNLYVLAGPRLEIDLCSAASIGTLVAIQHGM